jgi:predicted ATP-grasp superfamily ATP-dependent carboligase
MRTEPQFMQTNGITSMTGSPSVSIAVRRSAPAQPSTAPLRERHDCRVAGSITGTGTGARRGSAEVVLAGAVGRSGLAAARSLSRRGIPFVAVGHEPKGIVAASRRVGRYIDAPSPMDDPDGFFDVVRGACVRHEARLVIPVLDASLVVWSNQRDRLPGGTRLATASGEAVRNVLDKRVNLETASRLGIRCPAEFALERHDQIPDLIERIGFPMVLKNPGWGPNGSRPTDAFKWRIARDERELRVLLTEHSANGGSPILQELVEGEIVNLCCFAASGRIVALQQYRSVRRLAWAGTAVLREITVPDPRLVEQAERLLGELGWDGVAQVAFVVGPGDGVSWYMETNGRSSPPSAPGRGRCGPSRTTCPALPPA